MGDVEILIDEDGTLKVQRYNIRFLLRQLQPKDSERHRVDIRPNCTRWQDCDLNRGLTWCFLFTLLLAVIMMLIQLCWVYYLPPRLYRGYWVDWTEVPFLAAIPVLLIGAYVKMKMTKRAVEVETISSWIQQVKHQEDVKAMKTESEGL